MTTDENYLNQAIELAHENVLNGGGPFGAVIVLDGKVYTGVNRVTASNDPTAHAEVSAIRNTCAELETFDLTGATLYTSCEPCPMCLGASLWARVDRIVFAADRHNAAAAGFDDAVFYEKLAEGNVAEVLRLENHNKPFETWNTLTGKTEY